MTVAPSSVLVVGASAAGLATVEALRRKGYDGDVTVLGAEPHSPDDRPPLSKQVLSGAWALENRTNAIEQAAVVAANILGDSQPYSPVPYFWTDQYDVKIQIHGIVPQGAELTVVDGDPADRRFVAHYRHDGRIAAVLGWNMPKQTRVHRQEVLTALRAPVRSPNSGQQSTVAG